MWKGYYLLVFLWSALSITRGEGGGGTPFYKLCRYVPPHPVRFLCRFGLQTGIHFAHFGLESGMVFEGTTGRSVWTYLSFQFQKGKKERQMCEFEMDLKNFFCLRSNLRNHNIISAERPGLKTVWILTV